jgi:GTPase
MQNQPLKTIIIDIAPHWQSEKELTHRMDELESLVSTYGWVTIVKKVQKRNTPDYRTYIGSGKLDEIMQEAIELSAELLIIGNILKPGQIWNINEHLRKSKSKLQAWDRVDLILKIFALHAGTPESKLQIELAAIKHMWPRIYGMGMELSRQWWGSKNAKWQGETNTEIMKRHLREKERVIKEKLGTYERTRALHRENRKKRWLLTFGIVGYTNAGKSSLFNALTRKWVLAEDKLFATLGTSVGKMYLPHPLTPSPPEKENETSETASESPSLLGEGRGEVILLNDTIGFIKDLPPELIAAFTSTLEDSVESDVLLHVIDAGDEWMEDKIHVVGETLDTIGATQERWLVFNKSDTVSDMRKWELEEKYKNFSPLFVSAVSGDGLDALKSRIREKLV